MRVSDLFRREDDERCPSGQKYFDCDDNLFRGCCSVNPCKLPGCPDHPADSEDKDNEDPKDDGNKNTDEKKPDENKDEDKDEDKDKDGDNKDEKNSKSSESPKPSTIATVAPPVQASSATITSVSDDETLTLTKSTETTVATSDLSSMDMPAPEASTTDSLNAGATEAAESPAASAGSEHQSESGGLSAGAKGGIVGAIGAIIILIIAAYFLCGKRGQKLRKGIRSSFISRRGESSDKDDLQPYGAYPPPALDVPRKTSDPFAPFGGRYEEPQSRFTRASAFTASNMKNHPVSPMSREDASNMNFEHPLRLASPAQTAVPEYTRYEPTTPELQGSPQRAGFAELASPGLPQVVEIPPGQLNVQNHQPSAHHQPPLQQYRAYRPNDQKPYNVGHNGPARLRGDLRATPEDRSNNKYVNSWSRWDIK